MHTQTHTHPQAFWLKLVISNVSRGIMSDAQVQVADAAAPAPAMKAMKAMKKTKKDAGASAPAMKEMKAMKKTLHLSIFLFSPTSQ